MNDYSSTLSDRAMRFTFWTLGILGTFILFLVLADEGWL